MTHAKLKFGVAGVILAGAVAYLAFAGMQKGWVYTLGVDQYITQTAQHGQRVRLCGTVAEQDLDIHKAQLLAGFNLHGQAKDIRVAYKGVVPDMFKGGAEVVVEGKQDAAGVFQADVLMTKCASKYEDMPKDHPPVKPQDQDSGGKS